ncbi:NeuD/PglB/VioB family sugar acetyltransferase [Bacillus sp. NP157]|nr:NeuD/PglB/VioB family sugar acetyltransferase [Bacillus sp. NP157]
MAASTSPQERLAIFGTGGHAREAAWIAESLGYARANLVFVVDAAHRTQSRVNGIEVIEATPEACAGWPCVVAVGDPRARASIRERCTGLGMLAARLVAPSCALHDSVVLGDGVILAPGSVITVNVSLGNDVHVNVGASVSHDVRIGRFTTVSPGARIAGHVHIGESVFVGVGASIINGTPDEPLEIGDGAIIAAGACVIAPVARGSTVMGVPARPRHP